MAANIRIVWGDGFISVSPFVPECLTKKLKYWHRELEHDERRRGMTLTGQYRSLFSINTSVDDNQQIISTLVTMPGFLYRIKTTLQSEGIPFEIQDCRTRMPDPDYEKAFSGLRDYQCACTFAALMSGGGVLACPTGWGKCLAESTEIQSADGQVKPIREITVGDALMGDDFLPRKVLDRIDGFGPMRRLHIEGGQTIDVADDHVLYLVAQRSRRRSDPIFDYAAELTVNQYMLQSHVFKSNYRLVRVRRLGRRIYHKNLRFHVSVIPDGRYVGVRLDANMRHLSASGVVLHNTHIIGSILNAYSTEALKLRGTPLSVVAAPEKDIALKNYNDLKAMLPDRDLGLVMSGVKSYCDDIQVITLQSLHLLNPTDIGVLIIDEVHTAASAKRTDSILAAKRAARWGVSATPDGRFDGRDLVTEGLLGPVVYRRTYLEGIQDGAIVPIKVYWLPAPEPNFVRTITGAHKLGLSGYFKYRSRAAKYRNGVDRNDDLNRLIADILARIPDKYQTMCIMPHLDQMDKICYHTLNIPTVHGQASTEHMITHNYRNLAGVSSKERKSIYQKMYNAEIKKIISTHVYKQGVNFPSLAVIINAGGGGSEIVSEQIPGRESRNTETKTESYLIDFWHAWDVQTDTHGQQKPGHIFKDDQSRESVYTSLGFNQTWLNDYSELPVLKEKIP